MAIPETQELMSPILKLLADGKDYRIRELVSKLAEELELTDEELKELTPDGNQTKFYSRVTGARSYLNHAKILGGPRRGVSRITDRGLEIVNNPPEKITLRYLAQFPEFLDYLMNSQTAAKDPDLRTLLKTLQTEAIQDEELTEIKENEPEPAFVTESQLLQVLANLTTFNQEKEAQAKEDFVEEPVSGVTVKRNPDAFKKQPVNITVMALLRIVETYFQHPWLYLVPILVMTLACAAYFFLEKPPYISEGIISVQSDTLIENVAGIDTGGFNWVTPAQATSDEFNELLQTDAFIRLIVQQTPRLEATMDDGEEAIEDTITDAREAIIVFALGSNQIKLTAEYREPQTAHKLAEGAVNAFIQWKINSDKQDSISARIFIENLIPEYELEYNNAIEALEGYLIQFPEPLRGNRPAIEELQIERLQTEVSQAYNRFINAQENLEQIRLQEVIAEGTTKQTYTIVDYPSEPRKPEIYFADIATVIAIFAALGLTLTVMGVVGNSLIDRSMRLPIDARYVTDLEILAVVPAPPTVKRGLRRRKKEKDVTPLASSTTEEDPLLATTGD